MAFALRGQSSPRLSLENFYKDQKVLRFPSTDELSLFFCSKMQGFLERWGKKKMPPTTQESHCANSSPSSLGYVIARGWTIKAYTVTTTLQKTCQWKILYQLLPCMPILYWNGTFFQLYATFNEMGDVYLLMLNLKAISFTN